jgi:hypothetical protein
MELLSSALSALGYDLLSFASISYSAEKEPIPPVCTGGSCDGGCTNGCSSCSPGCASGGISG